VLFHLVFPSLGIDSKEIVVNPQTCLYEHSLQDIYNWKILYTYEHIYVSITNNYIYDFMTYIIHEETDKK
jgi:hypothetical protein